VNGDLKPDLVLLLGSVSVNGFAGPDSVVVFLNTGVAPFFDFTQPVRMTIPGGGTTFYAGDMAIADLNNDGLNDIVVVNSVAGQPGVVLMNHSPQRQPGFPITLQAGQVVNNADFLNVQQPSVGGVYGQLFEDANRNGRQDTGETGTAG